MIIEFFRVEYRPVRWPDTDVMSLDIQLTINGRDYHTSRAVNPDDVHSLLDRLFADAKHQFKVALDYKEAIPEQ